MLKLDNETRKITYKGKEVGQIIRKDGLSTLNLQLSIEAKDDKELLILLSSFSIELKGLSENKPNPESLILETDEDDIAEALKALRTLNEKQVRSNGHKWTFHKNDADNWPSKLHGHDYDNCLILDAITGEIFDSGTRNHLKTLKNMALQRIQSTLRKSNDFKEAVRNLIDKDSVTTGAS